MHVPNFPISPDDVPPEPYYSAHTAGAVVHGGQMLSIVWAVQPEHMGQCGGESDVLDQAVGSRSQPLERATRHTDWRT